jgi:hypothetical protein
MNVIGAVIAGIVGTIVISMMMALSPKMGMPKMDIVGMLSTMFDEDGNRTLGWIIHLMMGIIFAIAYAILWTIGIGSPTVLWGLAFGAIHWLFAGVAMGVMPMPHTGIREGTVQPPGNFMLNQGGMLAFMGGLMGHMLFGLVVALVYRVFI